MKYTDAEKLKAEIEKDTHEKSENPINHEWLKEEINRTYHDGSVTDTSDLDHNSYENIARHFYEIGCRRTAEKYDEIEYNRQRAEESVPNDLEEAAWKYAPDMPSYNIGGGYLPPQSRYDLRTAFKDGAKWDRSQMLKEAVECETVCIKDRLLAVLPMKEFRWTVGDKVRIIIVKED